MNRSITLSQAIIGYTIAAQARRLSDHTLADYANTFRKFTQHLKDDPPIESITADQVRDFLAAQTDISKKTLLNIHVGLSALWTWAVKESLVQRHIIHDVDPPDPEERAIVPYSEADVRAIVGSLTKSVAYTRPGKRECSNTLNSSTRSRGIVLLLLDTGIRASELCDLKESNTDMSNRRILVLGKGAKERMIPFSAVTANALWHYQSTRPVPQDNLDRMFLTAEGHAMRRDDLIKLCYRIGERAGVLDCHPHRFRHTFAISFLRNGGNAYALQSILGHTTMEMVRRYLAIAQADIEQAHRQASPVANWRL